MSIPSIPPLTLQQIAAGSEAGAHIRALQGTQAQDENSMEAALVAATAMAQAAESVAHAEESNKLEDQEQHGQQDRRRGNSRRQQHRHHVLEPDEDGEPHDGDQLDIVC